VFDQVAAWSVEIANFTSGREPEMIQYGLVSSNVFGVLGVQPRVGRAFLPAEDLRGCAPVVILGHNLWQRQFDADPNLLGKTVVIDGRPHEVIGIMPADFRFLNYASAGGRETEAWMPFGLNTWADGWNCRTCQWLNGAARLKDGVTLEQAQAGTDAIGKRLGTIHRELNWKLSLSTLNDVVVKDFRRALLILLGAVGVVLLIACTNVASLVLVRAQSREREIAFRAALGATRSRLVRQFLTENLVLSIGGGALGLLFAKWGIALLEMIETLPEVTSAGTVEYLPLSGGNGSNLTWIEGPPLQRVSVRFRHVSPRYFETLGIPLIEGRHFSSRDGKRAQPVAIVNEAMARRFWPDGKPLGKRLSFVGEALEFHEDGPPTLVPSRLREVVGVVGDIRHTRLGDPPAPELFIPADQQPQLVTAVVVRTRTDPMKLVKAVRHVVLSLDREQPISYVKTLDQYLSASVAKPRFNFLLMTVLAALSLILAIVGIYGLMSHTVAQRTREVGVRIALGADGYTVVAMLVRQGMWPALAGILIGLVAAAGLTQLLKSLLFDVTATDPMTFALVACLLTGAALVACYIPARRAATIGPIAALKCE
jgi:cell division protein FtsX